MSTVTSDYVAEEEPVMTSMAEGEEDPLTRPWTEEPWYTTLATGEEGDPEPIYDNGGVENPFGAF